MTSFQAEQQRASGQDGNALPAQPVQRREAGAGAPPPPPLDSSQLDPLICANFGAKPLSAVDGHKQIYVGLKLMLDNARGAMERGDVQSREHYLAAMSSLLDLLIAAVDQIGVRKGVGLNAMLKYVQGTYITLLSEPRKVAFNATVANAAYEAALRESGRQGA